MSREQSDGEHGVVGTGDGPVEPRGLRWMIAWLVGLVWDWSLLY